MAGWTRFELATFCVTGRRSNQLSYHPGRERTANVEREVGKSSAVCAPVAANPRGRLIADAPGVRVEISLVLLEADHHGPAADFAIVIEFDGQFLRRRSGDFELFEARRAGDGDEAGAHGIFPCRWKEVRLSRQAQVSSGGSSAG